MSATARARRWLEARYPMPAIRSAFAKQKEKLLPPHVGWPHTMGGMLIFLTVNQILTGILLMVYYRPTTEEAYESVRFLMSRASFGWLIRGLHAWGAHLMIAVLVLHMLRVFWMGAFKKPRELTWVGGVVIFFVTLTFGFTGYLLPWNQLAYWATTVGTEVTASIPQIGAALGTLVRGGDAVGQETLSRFYVLHVVVLPWVLTFLVIVHIVMIRMQGLAPLAPVGEQEVPTPEEGVPFAPHHLSRELVVFPLFFATLIALVILFPPEIGEKANPLVTPEGIKPEWYFLPTYQFLKYLPKQLGLALSALPPLIFLLWPFLDRSRWRRASRRRVSVAIGLAALAFSILLGVLGHLSESEIELFGRTWSFDMYGMPHAAGGQ
ncbi:MAG TPA: cytochrome b N-terminal domain-containing protein [Planctomycetota bacterium]|nr:cytochrome b N-terminal domain-containing protein [Planctomycetota bacterium]